MPKSLAGKPARQTTFLFWRKTKTGSALLQNLFSYICFDRIVLFLPRIKAKPAPQGIAQEQCSYQPKKITDADAGGQLATEKRPREHADELCRLIDTKNPPHQSWWCQLADKVIGGWHKARNRYAMEESQDSQLPWCTYHPLRNHNDT